MFMLREWANADQNDMIDEALATPPQYLKDDWDDEEAWQSFEAAMRAERGH